MGLVDSIAVSLSTNSETALLFPHQLSGGCGTRLSIRRQDPNIYSDTETRALSRVWRQFVPAGIVLTNVQGWQAILTKCHPDNMSADPQINLSNFCQPQKSNKTIIKHQKLPKIDRYRYLSSKYRYLSSKY